MTWTVEAWAVGSDPKQAVRVTYRLESAPDGDQQAKARAEASALFRRVYGEWSWFPHGRARATSPGHPDIVF
jgi:hypothetical protein